MKTLPFSMVLCWLAGASVACGSSFEGTISMNLTAGKSVMAITYYIKGDIIRNETQPAKGPKIVGLLDGKTGGISMLMTEQKMYMVTGAPKKGLSPDATFEVTGRTEEIAGYTCAEYVVRDKKSIIELWATSELGALPNLAEAFSNRGRRSAWETYAAEEGVFALRVITKDLKGRERSRLECVGVEQKSLDDELFTIPADFTRVKMPGLGDLLRP
jgi:hypothetical protein